MMQTVKKEHGYNDDDDFDFKKRLFPFKTR